MLHWCCTILDNQPIISHIDGEITSAKYGLKRTSNILDVVGVGFEVLTAVSMKIAVFWVVAPCSLVEVYQLFRDPCYLHHQGDE
jgi:hypothetical protein